MLPGSVFFVKMKKNYKHNDKNVAKFKNINSYELKNITGIAKKGKT